MIKTWAMASSVRIILQEKHPNELGSSERNCTFFFGGGGVVVVKSRRK